MRETLFLHFVAAFLLSSSFSWAHKPPCADRLYLEVGPLGGLTQSRHELIPLHGPLLCGPVCMTRILHSLRTQVPELPADEVQILRELLQTAEQQEVNLSIVASRGTFLEDLLEMTTAYLAPHRIAVEAVLLGTEWDPSHYPTRNVATAIKNMPKKLIPLNLRNLLRYQDGHTHLLAQIRWLRLSPATMEKLKPREWRNYILRQVRSFGDRTGEGHYVLLKDLRPQEEQAALITHVHDPLADAAVWGDLMPVRNGRRHPTFRLNHPTPDVQEPLLQVLAYVAAFRFYRF